jgi:hypothetical protein
VKRLLMASLIFVIGLAPAFAAAQTGGSSGAGSTGAAPSTGTGTGVGSGAPGAPAANGTGVGAGTPSGAAGTGTGVGTSAPGAGASGGAAAPPTGNVGRPVGEAPGVSPTADQYYHDKAACESAGGKWSALHNRCTHRQ